jgi:RNAse (barnase) inhibitor barstar
LTTYSLDGRKIRDWETFCDEFGRQVIPGMSWGRNLDALADVLRGGFGTPDEFLVIWRGSALSAGAWPAGPRSIETIVQIFDEAEDVELELC